MLGQGPIAAKVRWEGAFVLLVVKGRAIVSSMSVIDGVGPAN